MKVIFSLSVSICAVLTVSNMQDKLHLFAWLSSKGRTGRDEEKGHTTDSLDKGQDLFQAFFLLLTLRRPSSAKP
jgi:hypothetical protein